MKRKGLFTKILAVSGTVLAWLPILATLVTSVFGTIRSGGFLFDYLMPAELFPAAFVGGGLLLWAALRAQSRRGLIGWGLGLAVTMLVGVQTLAVVTGLASGETLPGGWAWMLVIGVLIIYSLALLMTGIAGILLTRDLFRVDEKTAGPVRPVS